MKPQNFLELKIESENKKMATKNSNNDGKINGIYGV
jgi:hypothetical protein